MAQQVTVTSICDMHGPDSVTGDAPEATRKRRLTVDGRDFELDVCAFHDQMLSEQIAPFLLRPVTGRDRNGRRPARTRSMRGSNPELAPIRAWARSEEGQQVLGGLYVADRGRIRPEVIAKYRAFHGLAQ
jgi:hypothetical protein